MKYVFTITLVLLVLVACVMQAGATDLTRGVMFAVPVPGGKAPTIDGNLADWDMSGSEQFWMTGQTAEKMHVRVALMYDAQNLYAAAEVTLPDRAMVNHNGFTDAFWQGDVMELRIAADPGLPAPLDKTPPVLASDRIAHLTMWKNTDTGKDYMAIAYGVNLDKGLVANPTGSEIVIKQHPGGYTIEAKIPWAVLHAPGGTNPFAPGSRMTAIWGVHWVFEGRTVALYRVDPGDFAFMRSESWGQVEFSPVGHLPARHKSMEETLAAESSTPVGVPITVAVPRTAKVSVNIFGPKGEVVRELAGAVERPKGPFTLYWDGRDQFGNSCIPGKYRWGAYVSGGLKAVYQGVFGMSGTPPFQTTDGKGGWIGDHSGLIDVAADSSGFYAMAPVAEAELSIIKLGYDDKTIWRRTPWIGGGFGPLYAIAANGKYLFATFGQDSPKLVRLDAATGQLLIFDQLGDAVTTAPISDAVGSTAPAESSPLDVQPESSGLAADDREVFVSVFSANLIQVLDAESGKPVRQLACPSPRGLALDRQGNLYAVSFGSNGMSKLVRFNNAQGTPTVVIRSGLVDPWHVAVDPAGQIYVSQEGNSQQIAVFRADGSPDGTIGPNGGRTWVGAYLPGSFRDPAGIAIDARGRLLVAEPAIPHVLSRFVTDPVKLDAQWFGSGAYWNADCPDPDNPRIGYYPFEPGGFARAQITSVDEPGAPTASWDFAGAGYKNIPEMFGIGCPELKYLSNGRKYMYSDTTHLVCLVDGDKMLPVGMAALRNDNTIAVWSDLNDNHAIDPGEEATIDRVDGAPLPSMIGTTGSMWLADNGDLYLTSSANKILRVPADRIDANGVIHWDTGRATWCLGPIIPSCLQTVYTTYRAGILGVRRDGAGNYYACYNYTLPVLDDLLASQIQKTWPNSPPSSWQAYANVDLATSMHEGLGHTAESNAVKFAKFDASGRLLWVAGRKATAAAGPGEMYHFWNMAGLIGDDYVAGGSEWGQIYLYTKDGFFVDALFNNPGLAAPPGPYTFGGETSGGHVDYFKKLGQVWAYCTGMAYLVDGFDKDGHVIGETRLSGTVTLDHIYHQTATLAAAKEPLAIVPRDPVAGWTGVPEAALSRNGAPLAVAQATYDAVNLYVRIHVSDPTPLQNGADDLSLAFKGGDAVGIDLGPDGSRNAPEPGDIRILAARIGGKDRLIAMKPFSNLKRPQEYYTPSTGRKHFDFVGEIPGGSAQMSVDADGRGYTALLTIPRTIIDFPLVAGSQIKADVEVLLSGQGARGLQATSRSWLYTSSHPQTSMTDDIPTEAWLYPQYWGTATVKNEDTR